MSTAPGVCVCVCVRTVVLHDILVETDAFNFSEFTETLYTSKLLVIFINNSKEMAITY